jgi:alkylated DNA nucleotide flippase Atl1
MGRPWLGSVAVSTGEALHRAGEDGVARAKNWLERTGRVDACWTSYDNKAMLTVKRPGGGGRSFDLGGVIMGGDLDGHVFYAEVKKYAEVGGQAEMYKAYLANCYCMLLLDSAKPFEFVHTLGNLTLSAYNSELSNRPFERKQQIYGESHLSLNQDLVAHPRWGRHEILARAAELAERAISVWPAPITGAAEESPGFDWARMHAAIAVIPDGRWTAYADLAALAGTAAQAVGNHIAANPSLMKAYRVLTADGRISEGFRWPDRADLRDPKAVLIAEGVQFDESGRAVPEGRLTADDLQALLGWFDPDDDLPDEPHNAALN